MHGSAETPATRRVARFPPAVVLVGIALVVLVVLALVVAVVLPPRPATYPAGSPEARFQAFYSAWEARDLDTAYALLSAEVRASITPAEYRRMDDEMVWVRSQDRRVLLLASEITADRAVLDLRVETFSSGGLGGQRYSYDQSIRLVREDGEWFIDQGLLGVEPGYYPGT